jgi:hypothetical protein
VKTFLALLLAAGTLLADDLPSPIPDAPRFMTWEESIELLAHKVNWCPPDPNPWLLGPEDGTYVAPTQAEIEDLVKFWLARKEMFPWIEEVFDCDDKATEFKYLASCWSVRHWHGELPGALVGKAYVKLDGPYSLFSRDDEPWVTGLHVIIFIVRNDGEVFFLEPQTGKIAEVSSFIYEGAIEVLRLEY